MSRITRSASALSGTLSTKEVSTLSPNFSWMALRPSSCWKVQPPSPMGLTRSEEHTSELQSPCNLVCRLLLEKKKYLLCLREDQTVADVANLMSSNVLHRFPVVRDVAVVRFLTHADVGHRLISP